jgi:hypothetical protein
VGVGIDKTWKKELILSINSCTDDFLIGFNGADALTYHLYIYGCITLSNWNQSILNCEAHRLNLLLFTLLSIYLLNL